jgi:hypothetical protein
MRRLSIYRPALTSFWSKLTIKYIANDSFC